MSTTTNPTPSQVLAALRDHGVLVRCYEGWDSKGRPWRSDEDPNGPGGLFGVINHHTATASASVSNPLPSLDWCANAYSRPAANMIVGKTNAPDGGVWLLSAGSCWHPGDGGPWKAIGINQPGNTAHYRLFGIEIDDPGIKVGSLTEFQIEQTARINAALWDLCGWPEDGSRIITHGSWTDGSYGVNPNGPSPFVGRKNDTIAGPWGDWPGATVARDYNPVFWREQARKYRAATPTWDGTVPSTAAVQRSAAGESNRAGWRVACRLFDLGFRKSPPKPMGQQAYPRQAVAAFREAQGWQAKDGAYSDRVARRLFGKAKP